MALVLPRVALDVLFLKGLGLIIVELNLFLLAILDEICLFLEHPPLMIDVHPGLRTSAEWLHVQLRFIPKRLLAEVLQVHVLIIVDELQVDCLAQVVHLRSSIADALGRNIVHLDENRVIARQ